MRVRRCWLWIAVTVMICSGCFAAPTAAPEAVPQWDENMNATARAVVAATFFAPTHTSTPTQTPTVTLTPTPTPATPSATPTLARAFCIPPDSTFEQGLVKRVIDGETIVVEIDGKEQQVRYIGISAPKDLVNYQRFGEKAASVNEDLVRGQSVRLYPRLQCHPPAAAALGTGAVCQCGLVRLGRATVVSDPPRLVSPRCWRAGSQKSWHVVADRATKTLGYGLERMTGALQLLRARRTASIFRTNWPPRPAGAANPSAWAIRPGSGDQRQGLYRAASAGRELSADRLPGANDHSVPLGRLCIRASGQFMQRLIGWQISVIL